MKKRTAIFLLQFFENIWINQGKAERKIEGTRVKKTYYYLPPLLKKLPIGALPTSYSSSHPPSQSQFYDYCSNTFNPYGCVLICGHAYHHECFIRIRSKCIYCLEYLSSSVDELTKSFNERLHLESDIENELDSPPDDDISLEQAERIKYNNDNDIDKELAKTISGI